MRCAPIAWGASQFLAAFGQSDAETHEKRGTAEPRFASRLATILPLPEGEGRGEGAFDVSLTYQKIEMRPWRVSVVIGPGRGEENTLQVPHFYNFPSSRSLKVGRAIFSA